jgi:hypothetical protein
MMSEHGGKTYRPWEPERYQQGSYRPAAKLSEGDLVFFLLETVPRMDLSRFYAPYEKEARGAPPYDPAMMSCLLQTPPDLVVKLKHIDIVGVIL